MAKAPPCSVGPSCTPGDQGTPGTPVSALPVSAGPMKGALGVLGVPVQDPDCSHCPQGARCPRRACSSTAPSPGSPSASEPPSRRRSSCGWNGPSRRITTWWVPNASSWPAASASPRPRYPQTQVPSDPGTPRPSNPRLSHPQTQDTPDPGTPKPIYVLTQGSPKPGDLRYLQSHGPQVAINPQPSAPLSIHSSIHPSSFQREQLRVRQWIQH